MKYYLFTLAQLFLTCIAYSQDFAGYRAGNYTGVNGVFFNPANIADSRYRFDFNLVSLSSTGGNNQASFNLKDFGKSIDVDSYQRQFMGSNSGPSSGILNINIHGPSLMFNVGKGALALTTRARAMSNIIDVDGELVNQLSEDVGSNMKFPYTINSGQNMRIAANAWSEFGVSYARVIKSEGAHFLKGGLTLKYLAGVGNGYIGLEQLRGTLTEDVTKNVYLTNASGRVSAGFGGVDISNLEAEDLTKPESSGFGADLGFVYEWRPDGEDYQLSSGDEMRDRNKYKMKVGLALLDIGKIKYNRDQQRSGGYDIAITGNERLNFEELRDEDMADYNTFFKSKPQFFTPVSGNNASHYKLSLPATLQLDLDYHLHRGFYANLLTQLSLQGKNTQVYNNLYYNSFTLTPRYEGRAFGFYLPLTYNQLTSFSAGVSLRLGPLFIGSGSILTAALGNSKQADVHLGLRFGGLRKDMQRKEDQKADRAGKRDKYMISGM